MYGWFNTALDLAKFVFKSYVGWKSHDNLGNDHGFIIKEYSLPWGLLGKPKAKPSELMLKVDNIIPLWIVVFI